MKLKYNINSIIHTLTDQNTGLTVDVDPLVTMSQDSFVYEISIIRNEANNFINAVNSIEPSRNKIHLFIRFGSVIYFYCILSLEEVVLLKLKYSYILRQVKDPKFYQDTGFLIIDRRDFDLCPK